MGLTKYSVKHIYCSFRVSVWHMLLYLTDTYFIHYKGDSSIVDSDKCYKLLIFENLPFMIFSARIKFVITHHNAECDHQLIHSKSFCRTDIIMMPHTFVVRVQFRGPELYKTKRALFREESYLMRNFRSFSLNLHTFHLINIVFWWQIFFHKHGKSTPNNREDHHILVVDIVIITSQCTCTRALSQSHVAKYDNHMPVTPLIGLGLAVMSMQWLPYGKIISTKTLKLHSNWGHPSTIVSPTCSWRHKDTM